MGPSGSVPAASYSIRLTEGFMDAFDIVLKGDAITARPLQDEFKDMLKSLPVA